MAYSDEVMSNLVNRLRIFGDQMDSRKEQDRQLLNAQKMNAMLGLLQNGLITKEQLEESEVYQQFCSENVRSARRSFR